VAAAAVAWIENPVAASTSVSTFAASASASRTPAGGPTDQIEPCRSSRIWSPLALPAGRARGGPPPTAQVSSARGENPTSTRSPGVKSMTSAAWARASS
jgi:hypothetical protein